MDLEFPVMNGIPGYEGDKKKISSVCGVLHFP